MPQRDRSFLDLLLSHPFNVSVSTLVLVYITTLLYVRNISRRDPTSMFFSPDSGYELRYSNDRLRQAEDFLSLAANEPSLSHDASKAQLCLGITSVARENARYLRTSVASLLEGLRQDERDSVYLVVLIAHSDPHEHPAYDEPWLSNLADQVAVYDLSEAELQHVKDMEQLPGGGKEKRLYDYMYLMKQCRDFGAPYMALFEDDTLAMDGWLHRTKAGLLDAEKLTATLRESSQDFYFLRLFYTEQFLGWDGDNEWPIYVFWSAAFLTYVVASIAWIRSQSAFLQRHTTLRAILFICGVCTPLFIFLLFAGGRITMFPTPEGVSELKHTCCSQAFVFPQQKAQDLIDWYDAELHRSGDVDVVIAHYGSRNDELKLTLTPSVIQHIGRVSSKGNFPHKIFNFAFETNDVEKLRAEHAAIADI